MTGISFAGNYWGYLEDGGAEDEGWDDERKGRRALAARAETKIYNTRRGWAGDFLNGKGLVG